MVILVCAAAFAQDVGLAAGAVLLAADRVDLDAKALAVSVDGSRVLVFGVERASLVGPDGNLAATAERTAITHGDVAANGRFALVHEGGVTIHGEGGREQLRMAAFGRVADIALSPDGRNLAVATSLALTVNDAVDGRTLWTNDGPTGAVGFDPKGTLWAERNGEVTGFNGTTGRAAGKGTLPVPAGLLPDGCLRGPDPMGTPAELCPVAGGVGLVRGTDQLWLLSDGFLQRWKLLTAEQIDPIGVDGGAQIVGLAWMGADLLVARVDGRLERRGADGAVIVDVAVPDCAGCTPIAMGGAPDGGFWVIGPTGGYMAWDATGSPAISRPRPTTVLAARGLPDGRFATVGADGKARIGSTPGKGAATKPVVGARGVDVAGDTVAVWSDSGLWTYDGKGRAKAAPSVGVGRKPVAVQLSPDGSHVAVIDQGGALHLYNSGDGKSVFRNTAALVGSVLGWSPDGSTIYAGGSPLRMFAAANGAETSRLVLSPSGRISVLAVGADGALAVVHGGDETQVLRRVSGLPGGPVVQPPTEPVPAAPAPEPPTPSDVVP